ncbi:DNA polymerase III subunit alpha [Allosphingosinicella vermicomposti]|uniref:DNA polymerase III subunit alpha n=1 Tax=Allosphingosinicella vermicomposti TaxID=614671 RepID=UPI000D0F84EC|nr:DNA polymerase III subunit alpha [Allosphingosinicella vermicomposti]
MASNPYVPLRVFSCYTMLDGAIEPKAIAKQAKKLDLPAVALTDRNGLYAAMAFTDACKSEGVQPVIGAMLAVARPGPSGGQGPILDWLALYAQDATGYDNLCALVSAAHLDRPVEEDAHVDFAVLAGRTDGLIALTAGGEGGLARLFAEEQRDAAEAYLTRLQGLFPGRLYVELCRRGMEVEQRAEAGLIDIAYARDLPLVATNPACFADAHFHQAHDAMLCIAQSSQVDRDDRNKSSPEAWMKPPQDMRDLFADIPEAIENTAVVAQRCAVGAPKRKPILPSLAGDLEGEAEQLRRDARAGLEARLAAYNDLGEEARQRYFDRLDFEVDVIVRMGFPGYFLIVADFIKWAKDNDIPVGPGRGSGAGSVVAWALTITDLDPLKLNLLFERFLNPERVSMPDFDIDFCETRRGEVIRYVQQKYGRDQVAQIITFGKLKARAVLKDTGRVLQMSYGQVDRLAKLVPNHPTDPWTLERALNGVSELAAEYKNDPQVRRLFDLAMKLEGLPRHSSTHAAGVVIGDRRLDKLVPLYRDPRSDMPVTQFDMKYVEGAGLVKFDFLGLKTLSVLQKAVQMLGKRGISVDLDRLEWDDEEVYKLLQRGETVGVFQLESEGMRRTLAAVKPTNFEDIIALVSLYRPGPMDNIPTFGARKNGREPIEYPHPLLEGVLKETYGIFVYQEQVMQAAQVLAGYSLGEADLLRRAMGKKIKAEMDAQRERFVSGCAAHQITPAKANELFDLIDKFAGYGFNKSHAAAYALVAYQTAWLKAHHPVEFYAASMCFDMHQTDKLAIFVEDMRRLEVMFLPPCINGSEAEFSVEAAGEGHAVRYALGALKGVGEKAMEQLCIERDAAGPYKDLDEFAARIDPRLLNRRQLESLAAGGAFDGIAPDRAAVFASPETLLAAAASAADARISGQGGLFGEGAANVVPIRMPTAQSWSLAERMAQEKEAFGFYFSAHPVDNYRHLAEAHGAKTFAQLSALPAPADGGRSPGVMAGLVEEARWRTSAKGRRYLMGTVSDSSGQFQVTVFDDVVAAQVEEAAKVGGCGLLNVELDRRPGEETPRVTIKSIQPFESLSQRTQLSMEVEVSGPDALALLAEALEPHRGGRGRLTLRVPMESGNALVLLGRDYQLDAEIAARIERLPGMGRVSLSASESLRLAWASNE